jgi:starch synthase
MEPKASFMRIVFAASECVPYAKTGGLADIIGALPAAVAAMGHEVTVYLPLYRQVQKHLQKAPRKVAIASLTIPFQAYSRFVTVVDGGKVEGVQHYFIDCPELFDRESLYGTDAGEYTDNAERFGLYCRAVIEASKQLGVPDVFHVHDWQASLVAVMLRTIYNYDPLLRHVPAVLTVHNAGYQGLFPSSIVPLLTLPWEVYTVDKMEFWEQVNLLKGGVVYSDAVATVSPRYAQEIQTPEYGFGLDDIFRKRSADLHGILDGVDYRHWDPAVDPKIAAHYTPEKLDGKVACRRDLLHAMQLDHSRPERPLLGIVSRAATQKGFDFIAEIAGRLAAEDAYLVVLGQGEPYYENLFRSIAERYPDRIAVRIAYDEVLAHKIEAGCDMFLMPSRYEPCGLNQIYSMKYGTVPIVRATGGLDDTVEEWDGNTETGTGFKFFGSTAEEFWQAIERALKLFPDKKAWQKLMLNGMAKNFSWEAPAAEYVKLYEETVKRKS